VKEQQEKAMLVKEGLGNVRGQLMTVSDSLEFQAGDKLGGGPVEIIRSIFGF
jgi:hypothetical protein